MVTIIFKSMIANLPLYSNSAGTLMGTCNAHSRQKSEMKLECIKLTQHSFQFPLLHVPSLPDLTSSNP